jgi:cobalt transporter subunit CbtA
MVRETILASVVAGIVAALVFALAQSIWLTPLILQGETYEDAAEAIAPQHEHAAASGGHHHDPEGWKPQNGWQRTLFTLAADVLMGVGYSFVLIALYLLWREPRDTLQGAVYGVAGYLTVFVAPGMGLPPELPGTAAAELASRQQWWAMVAVATAAGLMLLFSKRGWWLRVLGLAVIAAPHLIAAPQPAVEHSLAPPDLQSQFRMASAACNAVFWVSLGLASCVAFRKLVSPQIRVAAD